MLKAILFFDEITLWWDKSEFSKSVDLYKIYLDGKYVGDTPKTHWTFSELDPDREYGISIEAYVNGELTYKKKYFYRTKTERRRVDVSLPPYNATGDEPRLTQPYFSKLSISLERTNICISPMESF